MNASVAKSLLPLSALTPINLTPRKSTARLASAMAMTFAIQDSTGDPAVAPHWRRHTNRLSWNGYFAYQVCSPQ